MVRPSLLCLVALLAAALPDAGARAQTYPDRPIRLVIPFSPGGPNDLVARPLTETMAEALGQPFVIENKAGANGITGAQFVAKSPADGYTLLMTTGSFTANQAVSARPAYDALADFVAVTQLAQSYGIALMVRPAFPARSVPELVAMAKREPGKFSYAHSGLGNANYVAAELFQKLAGIELIRVPYKGTSSFATDIMSGQVDMGLMSTVFATPNVQAGLLRALATTGTRRAPSLPDTPTFQELGFADLEVLGYFGIWAPAGTPADRVERLAREAGKALKSPLVQKVLADSGLQPVGSSPAEFARYVEKDLAWQVAIMRRIGLQPE